ncbi:MAG: lipid-binding protein [Marinifilaceae bacterium]
MKFTYLLMLLCTLICGCQKSPEIGETATKALSGEWFVRAYHPETNTPLWDEYVRVTTYNSAANIATELIFGDNGNIFSSEIRLKVPCSTDAYTFGSQSEVKNLLSNEEYFVLNNGKVFIKGTFSPGGLNCDSICVEIKEVGEDGAHYLLGGYRRTGWAEDGY